MSTASVMLYPSESRAAAATAPLGEFVVRLGNGRPAHAVYVRRRLLVGLVVIGLFTVLGVSAHSVLADRGGVPASTPAIRPVNELLGASVSAPDSVEPSGELSVELSDTPSVVALGTRYIVQPGDTLWSLGELFHGARGIADYVDALVAANGGAAVQVGQLLTLP